jgi:hypothetical protein
LLHGLLIPVDTDEDDLGRSFEESFGVAPAPKRGVDDDSPVKQSGQEQLDDSVDEDGFVIHIAIVLEPS